MSEVKGQTAMFDIPPGDRKKGIRDPAMAVAVAKCIAHQLQPTKKFIQAAHPKECLYCKASLERKLAALYEFHEWAGFTRLPTHLNDPDWPDLRNEVEQYMKLPHDQQRRYAAAHAGYDPDWYETNTGYEYSPALQEVGIGKAYGGQGGIFTDDEKGTGTQLPQGPQRAMGGRPDAGEPGGRGVGGTEAVPRTTGRGLPSGGSETSELKEGSEAVPPDRYRDKGGNQPF